MGKDSRQGAESSILKMLKRTLTFFIAPEIPESERQYLQTHIEEAVHDPRNSVVVNYDVQITEVPIQADEYIKVIAPGVPVSEVRALRKRVNTALAAAFTVPIVVNYNIEVHVLKTCQFSRKRARRLAKINGPRTR